jgi:hypothetical protein
MIWGVMRSDWKDVKLRGYGGKVAFEWIYVIMSISSLISYR